MIETPKTFWNPAAKTTSQNSGRTIPESNRPRCWANLTTSRVVTAPMARQT